ncbi:hypothetical protein AVEN_69544-1 [Araneus ventricosus]|uniref:Uncharacterized protein n=1 Tax=Araneus ventricosus TaxID=182803 RepID=A0A4Y2UY96_ARAVE|nr:hypothetical protein AVEN_69544-1 [Araneus ventricosus]
MANRKKVLRPLINQLRQNSNWGPHTRMSGNNALVLRLALGGPGQYVGFKVGRSLSSPLLGVTAYSKQEERTFQSHLICFIGAIFVSPQLLHPDGTSHFTISLLIGLRRLTCHFTSTPIISFGEKNLVIDYLDDNGEVQHFAIDFKCFEKTIALKNFCQEFFICNQSSPLRFRGENDPFRCETGLTSFVPNQPGD